MRSARAILAELRKHLAFDSVLDVGCGVGAWLTAAREIGATRLLGVDGDYLPRQQLMIQASAFQALDLEQEDLERVLDVGQRFDLTICVEVAEHLSASRAPALVRGLCASSNLVLFSCAIPGQGGTGHVNEQWPQYWSDLFAALGYACFDILRLPLWQAEAEWWYVQNVLTFAKLNTTAHARLATTTGPVRDPLPLVHPRLFEMRR